MFDASLVDSSILAAVQDLKFLPGIGLIAIIDSQKGDYRNLAIAYMLARDITLNAKTLELDTDVLKIIVNRLIKDARDMALVKHLVTANIDNMKQILAQIEKVSFLPNSISATSSSSSPRDPHQGRHARFLCG